MQTTTFVPGAPNWIDLGSPDVDAAAAFYGAVLGWELQTWDRMPGDMASSR